MPESFLAVWATSPTAGSALSQREFIEHYFDSAIFRFLFFGGLSPAYPLITCERGDILPYRICTWASL